MAHHPTTQNDRHQAPGPPGAPRLLARTEHGTLLADLTVARIRGYRDLQLDLRVPDRAGPAPVVFWIHGGGWCEGNRSDEPEPVRRAGGVRRALLSRGFAVADVEYRLSREAPWPAQLHDVKAAIRWVRTFAPDLGVDPDHLSVLGYSAGAHLAALVGLTGGTGSVELEGTVGTTRVSSAVEAAVAWYGPMDLAAAARGLGCDPAAPDTPFSWLLCVHGTDDRHVSSAHSEDLIDRLCSVGVRCGLHLVPGADHDFVGAEDVRRVIDLTVDFLSQTSPGV